MSFLMVSLLCVISLGVILSIRVRFTRFFILVIMLIFVTPLIISLFNPFGLFEVSSTVYTIAAFGYLSILFGFVTKRGMVKPQTNENYIESIEHFLSNKKFVIIYLLALGTLISLASTQWLMIAVLGGMGNLKLDVFEIVFGGNSALYFFYMVLLVPLFHLSSVTLALLIFNNKFNLYTLTLFIYSFVFCFIGGKRGYYAIMLEYFIIAYILHRLLMPKQTIRKKKMPVIKLSIFVLVIFGGAGLMTTIGRSGTDADKDALVDGMLENAENFIKYQIGPYRALDYAIQHDYIEKYGGYTLGRATFGGMIDYYGCGLLSRMGIPCTQVRALAMSPLQENSIVIGKDTEWNFSYTSFYYFLFDLGIFGVLIFSFLFGKFIRYSLNLFYKKQTLGSMVLLGYVFIACVNFSGSWFNVELYTQPAIILFIWLSKYEKRYASIPTKI